jgi:hypothetical protein
MLAKQLGILRVKKLLTREIKPQKINLITCWTCYRSAKAQTMRAFDSRLDTQKSQRTLPKN